MRACSAGVAVDAEAEEARRDPKLVVVTTQPRRRFRTRVPQAAGRYYVVVRKRYAAGVAECGGSRSTKVRVRR